MKFRPIYLLYVLLLLPFLYVRFIGTNPSELDWEKLEVNSLEGVPVDISEYKGKRIVINFWATWCGPCIKEMPSLEAARKELAEMDYVFLLISDETIPQIKAFKASKPQYGFEFLQLTQSINAQGIRSIPQTYIINRNGEVVDAISGMVNWENDARLAKLKSIP